MQGACVPTRELLWGKQKWQLIQKCCGGGGGGLKLQSQSSWPVFDTLEETLLNWNGDLTKLMSVTIINQSDLLPLVLL